MRYKNSEATMTLTPMQLVRTRLNQTSRSHDGFYRPERHAKIEAGVFHDSMFCGTPYKLPEASVIAVDLDGTLAKTMKPYDPSKIGPPIPRMVIRIQRWLKQGKKVVILTARMNTKAHTPAQLAYTRTMIKQYTKTYIGTALPCTAEKHSSFRQIYDDLAIQVKKDTGKLVR